MLGVGLAIISIGLFLIHTRTRPRAGALVAPSQTNGSFLVMDGVKGRSFVACMVCLGCRLGAS